MGMIQSPYGFELAEPLKDDDLKEVYQPGAGGLRHNKKALLSVLKTYFNKVILGTPAENEVIISDGFGQPQGSGVDISEIATDGVFANTDSISAETEARIDGDDDLSSRVSVLEGSGTPQGVGTGDTPSFDGISTDNAIVKTKQISGTLDEYGQALGVPHGLDRLKIFQVQAMLGSYDEHSTSHSANWLEPKNVIIYGDKFSLYGRVGSEFKPYNVMIFYEG